MTITSRAATWTASATLFCAILTGCAAGGISDQQQADRKDLTSYGLARPGKDGGIAAVHSLGNGVWVAEVAREEGIISRRFYVTRVEGDTWLVLAGQQSRNGCLGEQTPRLKPSPGALLGLPDACSSG